MSNPKVWGTGPDTARIVGEAKIRALEQVDVPHLKASGPGFTAYKMGSTSEVHIEGGAPVENPPIFYSSGLVTKSGVSKHVSTETRDLRFSFHRGRITGDYIGPYYAHLSENGDNAQIQNRVYYTKVVNGVTTGATWAHVDSLSLHAIGRPFRGRPLATYSLQYGVSLPMQKLGEPAYFSGRAATIPIGTDPLGNPRIFFAALTRQGGVGQLDEPQPVLTYGVVNPLTGANSAFLLPENFLHVLPGGAKNNLMPPLIVPVARDTLYLVSLAPWQWAPNHSGNGNPPKARVFYTTDAGQSWSVWDISTEFFTGLPPIPWKRVWANGYSAVPGTATKTATPDPAPYFLWATRMKWSDPLPANRATTHHTAQIDVEGDTWIQWTPTGPNTALATFPDEFLLGSPLHTSIHTAWASAQLVALEDRCALLSYVYLKPATTPIPPRTSGEAPRIELDNALNSNLDYCAAHKLEDEAARKYAARVFRLTPTGASVIWDSDPTEGAFEFFQNLCYVGNRTVLAKAVRGFPGIDRAVKFYRSTDNGTTWTEISTTGLPASMKNQFFGNMLCLAPATPLTPAEVAITAYDDGAYRVYHSKDGGTVWKEQGTIAKTDVFRRVDTMLGDDGGSNFDVLNWAGTRREPAPYNGGIPDLLL